MLNDSLVSAVSSYSFADLVLGLWLMPLPRASILSAHISLLVLFPTCQVRVVRFYQSCCPPPPPPPPVSPRPCLHQLPRPLPPCQLFANLFANFRAQWALLDLNCRLWPCQLVANLFANFRAQWAPLDLNCRLPI